MVNIFFSILTIIIIRSASKGGNKGFNNALITAEIKSDSVQIKKHTLCRIILALIVLYLHHSSKKRCGQLLLAWSEKQATIITKTGKKEMIFSRLLSLELIEHKNIPTNFKKSYKKNTRVVQKSRRPSSSPGLQLAQ